MAAAAVTYNRVFLKIQNALPGCVESNNINLLKEVFDFKIRIDLCAIAWLGGEVHKEYLLHNMSIYFVNESGRMWGKQADGVSSSSEIPFAITVANPVIQWRDDNSLRTDGNVDLPIKGCPKYDSEGVKCFVEASVRDYLIKKVCFGEKTNLKSIEAIVNMCIEGVRQDLCLPTLPVLVLSDGFDCLTIQQCEELFEFVESKVAVWKEELFFSPCKNQVLRMCNDVLRRLSRSQNTIFCGRILLFLARFFPFSERSGLNLISEFNLENITTYTDTESADMEIGDGDVKELRPSLDYTLYTKFWALQDFFRNPVQCYQASPWKIFTKYADDILEAFSSFKLDNVQTKSVSTENGCISEGLSQEEQYFPKYLTNQKLLDLQFSDSNFRRYILVQMLILSQYLSSNIKFKQETLNEEQNSWVKKLEDKALSLLTETPPNGKEFVDIVKHIQKREEMWSEWKNNGCPEIKKGTTGKRKIGGSGDIQNGKPEGKVVENKAVPIKRIKRKVDLGEMIKEADSKNKYVMGNAEMTRLWNIFPNNLEACQQKNRDFVPSVEAYFQTAIEQSLTKDPVKEKERLVNDSNFGWRALRLLAQKSPHFFTHSANSIATLPEYLGTMVKKLAKDLPSQQVEEGEEEKEEEKEIAMLDQNDAAKEEEEEEIEEEPPRDEQRPINEEERKELAKAFKNEGGDSWKILGKKLDFTTDEIEYFVSEKKTLEEAIETMFDRWVENEKEEANKEYLLYTLEGLKMEHIVKDIF